jgi:hypothetical protein
MSTWLPAKLSRANNYNKNKYIPRLHLK